MADVKQAILNIIKRRATSYGIPNGSTLSKVRPDDLIGLSKKTYALLILHDTVPSHSRVFIGKLDAKGFLKNYVNLDIPGKDKLRVSIVGGLVGFSAFSLLKSLVGFSPGGGGSGG